MDRAQGHPAAVFIGVFIGSFSCMVFWLLFSRFSSPDVEASFFSVIRQADPFILGAVLGFFAYRLALNSLPQWSLLDARDSGNAKEGGEAE